MSFPLRITTASLLTALVSSSGLGQVAPPGSGTAASEPAASAAGKVQYRSVFENYRAYKEQPVTSWREANDLVGRIGGWQAYAREGQAGDAPQVPHEGTGSAASPASQTPGASPKPAAAPAKDGSAARSAPSASDAHSGHKTP